MKLEYEKKSVKEMILKPKVYESFSEYKDERLRDIFLSLKANICDLNPAIITKCVTGTEQDYVMLLDRAERFLKVRFPDISDDDRRKVLKMFRECVFGYYVLTPLIEAKEVSDIKVLDFDHIVVKANGKRFVSDLSFFDREDYKDWFNRTLRLLRMGRGDECLLNHTTDRKGSRDFFLRVDVQLDRVTSTEKNNIHIRKIPKKKLTFGYLIENKMLDEDILEYLKDRILAGFGFLISGKGGSGKSTLLNSMIDLIPFDESVLVSQESDELYSKVHPQVQFEHTCSITRKDKEIEISLEDELRLGLLQDIDNFVIGEIKGGEALYVFTTAMSTGARFFGTIHSNDAASSVRRLSQCARYISDYPMDVLEEMLSNQKMVLIHMSSFAIDEILEIDGFDDRAKRLIFKRVYRKEGNAC